MRRNLLAISITLLVVCAAGTARAQWGVAHLNEPSANRLVDGLELAFWGDAGFYAGSMGDRNIGGTGLDIGNDLLSFTPTFGVMARFLEYVGAELVVPLAFGHFDPWGSERVNSALQAGNPWLAGYFVYDIGARGDDFVLLLRGGLGFTFPGAHVNTDSPDAGTTAAFIALLGGIATRGGWNGLWYLEDHFGFGIPLSAEMWFGGIGYAAAEVGFWWAFNQNPGPPFGRDPDDTGALQIALEGGVELLDFLRITLRVQGVGELEDPDDRDDDFQLAIEPRVAVAHGPIFGSLGLLVNLDEPAGVFGDDDDGLPGIYAFRLTVGARM